MQKQTVALMASVLNLSVCEFDVVKPRECLDESKHDSICNIDCHTTSRGTYHMASSLDHKIKCA